MNENKKKKTSEEVEVELAISPMEAEETPRNGTQAIENKPPEKVQKALREEEPLKIERAPEKRMERSYGKAKFVPQTTTADLVRGMGGVSRSRKGLYFTLTLLIAGLAYWGNKMQSFEGAPASSGSSVKEQVTEQVVADAFSMAEIEVESDILGFDVTVNGVSTSLTNNRFKAPTGKLDLVFSRLGYESYPMTVVISQGEQKKVRPVFTPEKKKGFFSVETSVEAKVFVYQGDQLVFEKDTPLKAISLPVGRYKAVFENPFTGLRVEDDFVVEEWKTTILRKRMSP